MKNVNEGIAGASWVVEKRNTLSGILKIDRDLDFPKLKLKIDTCITY